MDTFCWKGPQDTAEAMAPTESMASVPGTVDLERDIRLLLRNRWQQWSAVLVILLLLGAIVIVFLPSVFAVDQASVTFRFTRHAQELLGLILGFTTSTVYQQRVIRRLRRQLATQLKTVTAHQTRANTLYELAVLDPLTGLYNRRFVEERLRAEFARAERHGYALILLLLDLDDFKQINDRFGHAAGDLVLKELAHRIRRAVRASDFAVRMGSDEFLVLLPECPPDKVNLVLSRLGPIDINVGEGKMSVTSSKGFAQYLAGETVEQLVARADAALYASKAARHKTESSQDALFPTT